MMILLIKAWYFIKDLIILFYFLLNYKLFRAICNSDMLPNSNTQFAFVNDLTELCNKLNRFRSLKSLLTISNILNGKQGYSN